MNSLSCYTAASLCLMGSFTLRAPLPATDVSTAVITEVGIYSAQTVNTVWVPSVVSQTNSEIKDLVLLRAGTNVVATLGTRFGFRFTVIGTPTNAPIVLTMLGVHPPLTNPVTGRTETKDVYSQRSWIGTTYTTYSFDNDWEMVPGIWHFEIWFKEKKLCEQDFDILKHDFPSVDRLPRKHDQ